MTKIAVIGASGRAGSEIVKELSRRGHQVTGIARKPEAIAKLPGVTAKAGDAGDRAALAALLKGHEVAVSAIHFLQSDAPTLIGAVKDAGVGRYLVVGGAGSLNAPGGGRLYDTPEFPDAYRSEARKGGVFLDLLRLESDLDWTLISPAAEIFEGERKGADRTGRDDLVIGADGSRISFADYAIALVDEIETPKHRKARFTVGY